MTLRKITIDSRVKYISKDSNSQSNFKPGITSLPEKKQDRKFSEIDKKN